MSALISWQNVVDGATVTASSAESGFPATNVQQRGLATAWRSQVGTTASLEVDNTANHNGGLDLDWVAYTDNTVNVVVTGQDGHSYIGGSFTSTGGFNENHRITMLDPIGVERPFMQVAADDVVNAIAIRPANINVAGHLVRVDIVVFGGAFTAVDGQTRNRIASCAVRYDGVSPGLSPDYNINANSIVFALAFQPDGVLWVGGLFTILGGVANAYLGRILADGTRDSNLTALPNGPVKAIAVAPDGGVFFGGDFTNAGGFPLTNKIGRRKPDGSLDLNWHGAGSLSGLGISQINAIAVQPDGKIIIGGNFTDIGVTTRKYLARLNANGSLDSGFDPTCNSPVNAIHIQKNGQIMIGGAFTQVGGQSRNRIARINEDGSIDPGFSTNSNGVVNSIDAYGDDQIIIAGYFSQINNVNRSNVAVISTNPQQHARIAMLMRLAEGKYTIDLQRITTYGWVSLGSKFITNIPAKGKIRSSVMWTLPDGIGIGEKLRFVFSGPSMQFEVARAWIGDALVLDCGIDSGWQMGFRDSGTLDPTDGQQWVASPGVRTRVLTIPIEGAYDTETVWGFADDSDEITRHANLHALQMDVGTTGEVIAIPRTNSELWIDTSAVYGHIESLWAIGHKAGPYWGATITVVEEK